MKTRTKAFTLVELLTVIGIISLLLALALPALNEARMKARIVGDTASLNSIGVAIESFAGDMGYYPKSRSRDMLLQEGQYDDTVTRDQGAHRLVEAMIGLETLGFQKEHFYLTEDGSFTTGVIEPGTPIVPNPRLPAGYEEAKLYGPYMSLDSVELGTMQEAHPNGEYFPDGGNNNRVFTGTLDRNAPKAILYYRAHASRRVLGQIYNYEDNEDITTDYTAGGDDVADAFYPEFNEYDGVDFNDSEFERFIWDQRTGTPIGGGMTSNLEFNARPQNKDTFILINAGRDNRYGTVDDICNFQKK